MSLALFKYVFGDWDEAKGYLYEDLEHIEVAINQFLAETFDESGNLLSAAIAGDATPATRYVANTGPHSAPKWDRVNLANGVKNRLTYSNLPTVSSSRVIGRGSLAGPGNAEALTLGTGLVMTGTVLDAAPTAAVATPDVDILTHPFMGNL